PPVLTPKLDALQPVVSGMPRLHIAMLLGDITGHSAVGTLKHLARDRELGQVPEPLLDDLKAAQNHLAVAVEPKAVIPLADAEVALDGFDRFGRQHALPIEPPRTRADVGSRTHRVADDRVVLQDVLAPQIS